MEGVIFNARLCKASAPLFCRDALPGQGIQVLYETGLRLSTSMILKLDRCTHGIFKIRSYSSLLSD